MLTAKKRTSARCATRSRDKSITEQHTTLSDAIDIRSANQRLQGVFGFVLCIGAGIAAPVIGKQKKNVRGLGRKDLVYPNKPENRQEKDETKPRVIGS
jgi:hypothetical protein